MENKYLLNTLGEETRKEVEELIKLEKKRIIEMIDSSPLSGGLLFNSCCDECVRNSIKINKIKNYLNN